MAQRAAAINRRHYHAVQFYQDDVSLTALVARFLADGWKQGQPAEMANSPLAPIAQPPAPNNLVYQIFVRSFADGDNDAEGIGDLKGIVERLDTHLNDGDAATDTDLEVGILWLMPIFPSGSTCIPRVEMLCIAGVRRWRGLSVVKLPPPDGLRTAISIQRAFGRMKGSGPKSSCTANRPSSTLTLDKDNGTPN